MKLTLELVPQSSWSSNVRSYLSKSQWSAISKKVRSQVYDVCEICEIGEATDCHEIWEYHEKTKVQKLAGMIALCKDCHLVKHFGFANTQGKGEQALKHFMKVNGLKKKEAQKVIAEAFDLWSKRSLVDWKLDLSGLKKYGVDVAKLHAPLLKPSETK